MKVLNLFNDSKYTRTYIRLMDKAKDRAVDGYFEKHHITPKSLGGDNTKDNIVKLTAREHFIAHMLLYKAVQHPSHKAKMGTALNRMLSDRYGNRYMPSSRLYALARKAHAQSMRERSVSDETREKSSKARIGIPIHGPEARAKMSAAKLGKKAPPRTPEHMAKISAALTGKKASEETKQKLSAAKLGKPGVPRTQEWKDKIAASQKLRWEKRRAGKSTD